MPSKAKVLFFKKEKELIGLKLQGFLDPRGSGGSGSLVPLVPTNFVQTGRWFPSMLKVLNSPNHVIFYSFYKKVKTLHCESAKA